MKIYLDNCCFNRPFDDQAFLTIKLETEAKLDIQAKIKSGHIGLAWSYILDFENNANPFIERKTEIQKWKEIASSFTGENAAILKKMNELTAMDLKSLDALHIACAIPLKCQSFLTVDKGILKKTKEYSEIQVTDPINFIIEWEAKQ